MRYAQSALLVNPIGSIIHNCGGKSIRIKQQINLLSVICLFRFVFLSNIVYNVFFTVDSLVLGTSNRKNEIKKGFYKNTNDQF